MSGGGNEKRPPAGKREGAPEGDRRQLATGEKVPETGGARDHEHLLPDPDAAVAFLEAWRPGGPWVLTAIEVDPPKGRSPKVPTATLTSPDAVRRWIHDHSGGQWNQYFTYNDVRGPVSKKPTKADMAAAVALCFDIDPRAGEPLDAERGRISRQIDDWEVDGRKLAFPRPSVTIDSGGGMQGFFLLAEPVPLDGAEGPATARVELHGRGIVEAFKGESDKRGADSVQNVDRIMRLPGTVNWPNEAKRRKGRVPRLARVVEAHWDRRYRLEDFPEGQAAGSGAVAAVSAAALPEGLPDLMGAEDPRLLSPSALERAVIMHGLPPDDPGRFSSRSEALFHVLCARVRAGVPDDVLAAMILDPDLGISEHVLGQPKPRQYAARQIARAKADVEAATDPLLREMNERHALLTHEGKKAAVAEFVYELLNPEERDPARQRWRWATYFQSAADFRLTFDNRMVEVGRDKDGNPVKKSLGDAWLRWAGRREHRSLTFDPGAGEMVGDKLNLWRGFAVRPAPGDWSLMQTHIHEVLADGDPEVARYILRWLALAVQRPQQPAGVALVFRGGRGSGKGIFAHYARAMFGQHGFYIPGAAALGAKFNAHIRDTVLLYADEVKWNGNKNAESLLQAMVTEPELLVEGKYRDAALAKNRLHLIITSNEDWVVPAAIDERRFAVFRPSDKMQGPKHKPYFDAIGAQMDGSGLAAMLHDLLAMDLTGFNVREMPESRELSQQKMEGLTGPDRIDMEMLMGGIAPGGTNPYMQVGKQRYQMPEPVVSIPAVVQWAVDRRIVRDAPSTQRMGRALERIGAKRDRFYDARGVQFWAWSLPPLAEARATWAKKLGLSGIDWPEGDGWTCPPSQD